MRRLTVAKSPLHSRRVNERNRLWVLKNSFQGISITKFVRKLLNVRSPQTLEFAEITALVPFSTPTGDNAQNPVVSAMAIFQQLAISLLDIQGTSSYIARLEFVSATPTIGVPKL